jgi:hypothetical protein
MPVELLEPENTDPEEAAHVAEVYLPRRVVANAAGVQAARIALHLEVALAGPLELGEEGVVPHAYGGTGLTRRDPPVAAFVAVRLGDRDRDAARRAEQPATDDRKTRREAT